MISEGGILRLQHLKKLLQQGVRNCLLERIALGFDNLPITLPQRVHEFMNEAGLSYSSRSHHGGDFPERADGLRRALELRNLFLPADEG
ncbi:hypothetical protein [Bradyrhizobium sp. 200]|uniref:hypothetical protein n=1 Tax=Bradyrhizobium sp. 200 TaxID=2782665 RepID=UPI001FFF4AAA|nr:hypothetical protein [Bradyrhizobium sp. 200]